MKTLLCTIAAILLLVWMIGFLFKPIVSSLIHLALLEALIVLVYHDVAGRSDYKAY